MNVETVPIGSVHEDLANARKHPERNLAAIKASLARFGQQKPIVVDSKGVVRAGNGTLTAARALGWETIAIVRSELQGVEATAYAIADNRSAELADWDDEVLAKTLRALQSEDFNLEAVGYDAAEVDALLESLSDDLADQGQEDGEEEILPERWMIVIDCRSEPHQVELLNRFQQEGLECKAIVA